jgi:hypothetical protein
MVLLERDAVQPAVRTNIVMRSEGMDRRRATLLLAVVIALGVTLRIVGLQYGLPAVYNPDEVAIMNRALAFATGNLNPHNFVYPTLYFYVLFAWEGLAFVAGRVSGIFDSTAAFERSFFADPTYIYTAGRLFTTFCGVATIVATYALARRVAGRTAAVTAAALLAVAPLAVRDAHYVKHDVPVTLLIVLTHIAILRVNGAPRAWFVAGGLAGLAVSTHYYAVLLTAPFLAVLAVDARHGRTGNAVRGLAVAAMGGFVAVLITSPFLFADPAATLADMRANRQIVMDRATDTLGLFGSLTFYGSWLFRDASGAGAFLLAVAGVPVALACGSRNASIVLAFPVAFLLFIANTFPASRYLNPILPFVAILGGLAISWLVPRGGVLRLAGATVAVLAIGEASLASARTDRFFRQADTRTQALDWLEQQVPAGTTILVEPYSVPLRMSRDALAEALTAHLGSADRASIKFQRILALDPYPAPAYRAIYLGSGGLDVDRIYVDPADLDGRQGLAPLRALAVTHVILKQDNSPKSGRRFLEESLRTDGHLLVAFSPYAGSAKPGEPKMTGPFLHNTDATIGPDLERPGPLISIWTLDR